MSVELLPSSLGDDAFGRSLQSWGSANRTATPVNPVDDWVVSRGPGAWGGRVWMCSVWVVPGGSPLDWVLMDADTEVPPGSLSRGGEGACRTVEIPSSSLWVLGQWELEARLSWGLLSIGFLSGIPIVTFVLWIIHSWQCPKIIICDCRWRIVALEFCVFFHI